MEQKFCQYCYQHIYSEIPESFFNGLQYSTQIDQIVTCLI